MLLPWHSLLNPSCSRGFFIFLLTRAFPLTGRLQWCSSSNAASGVNCVAPGGVRRRSLSANRLRHREKSVLTRQNLLSLRRLKTPPKPFVLLSRAGVSLADSSSHTAQISPWGSKT